MDPEKKLVALIEEGQTWTFSNFANHGESRRIDNPLFYGFSTHLRESTLPESELPAYASWRTSAGEWIRLVCGPAQGGGPAHEFQLATQTSLVRQGDRAFNREKSGVLAALQTALQGLRDGLYTPGRNAEDPTAESVRLLCRRFHSVAAELRHRHDGRETLDVHDEYDVQDLLHALLSIHFDDIRPEEWTPSYAGSSSRMDFFLPAIGLTVEVKKTRHGLDDRKLGSELIEDSAHYRARPDCRHLICFVYDPDNRVRNPKGLTDDLAKGSREDFTVEVIVEPRRR